MSGLCDQPLNTNIPQSRSSLTLNLSRSIDRARIRDRLVQRHWPNYSQLTPLQRINHRNQRARDLCAWISPALLYALLLQMTPTSRSLIPNQLILGTRESNIAGWRPRITFKTERDRLPNPEYNIGTDQSASLSTIPIQLPSDVRWRPSVYRYKTYQK